MLNSRKVITPSSPHPSTELRYHSWTRPPTCAAPTRSTTLQTVRYIHQHMQCYHGLQLGIARDTSCQGLLLQRRLRSGQQPYTPFRLLLRNRSQADKPLVATPTQNLRMTSLLEFCAILFNTIHHLETCRRWSPSHLVYCGMLHARCL